MAGGPVYACALNVGWSPFFKNREKTIEIHVIAQLDDFYGQQIRAVALGYVRPEADFAGLEALKLAIAEDVLWASEQVAHSAAAAEWTRSAFLTWRE